MSFSRKALFHHTARESIQGFCDKLLPVQFRVNHLINYILLRSQTPNNLMQQTSCTLSLIEIHDTVTASGTCAVTVTVTGAAFLSLLTGQLHPPHSHEIPHGTHIPARSRTPKQVAQKHVNVSNQATARWRHDDRSR